MFKSLNFFILISCIVFSTVSCADQGLRFIGDVNIPTGEKFQETELGGLSGITYDKEEKKIIAISDDRSQKNEARFYTFDLTLNENEFSTKPHSVIKLKNKDGNTFKEKYTDFEGITLLGKDILVSSENGLDGETPVPPRLYRFNLNGDFKELIEIPAKFLPLKDASFGSRNNKGFESLASTPDQKTFFMANEDSLAQDGPLSTIEQGGVVRIIRYKSLKPDKEFAYQLEKITPPPPGQIENGDTGLVDFAFIDENTFYSIERSFLTAIGRNVILIYKNKITTATTDVSSIAALEKNAYTPVEKKLVANLENFVPLFNKDYRFPDNVEGITLGPILANGHQSLIIAGDNNFNASQRTLFVAFEILE